jgi:hypothetical protein
MHALSNPGLMADPSHVVCAVEFGENLAELLSRSYHSNLVIEYSNCFEHHSLHSLKTSLSYDPNNIQLRHVYGFHRIQATFHEPN